MYYLIEWLSFDPHVYRLNGRLNDSKNSFVRFQGEIYEMFPVKSENYRLNPDYDITLGRIDTLSNPEKLNGVPIHRMVNSKTYDCIMQTLEDFHKNGLSKGEYNRAIEIAKKMKLI